MAWLSRAPNSPFSISTGQKVLGLGRLLPEDEIALMYAGHVDPAGLGTELEGLMARPNKG